MTSFPYIIDHVVGEANVWVDPLIRRLQKILGIQKAGWKAAGDAIPNVTYSVSDRYYVTVAGKLWIPDAAVDLQQRFCIIAHQGAADMGFRRQNPFKNEVVGKIKRMTTGE
ncbi:hypothetical protein H257_16283 [Aphanomyces astaci]|uniref:Uncharacterized protein n=1 Tax=Aphanomyces astaci TaxID=112090 RepID=W4FJ92_APHAT|nr:hypothetical protein H257_16283 [Aphanomyces astaci]ETV67552.1 hypothetical protein H257_16283 [Aphanomyces astaci]|eukprot:XP_009842956.1 hypothetical protein H257_16283 [Aphanomyces astaci]